MYKGLIASIKRKELKNPFEKRKKNSNISNQTTTPLPSNRQSSSTLNASTTVKQAQREKVIKIPLKPSESTKKLSGSNCSSSKDIKRESSMKSINSKNSNGKSTKSTKNILDVSAAVYDKYKEAYSKFLNENKDKLRNDTEDSKKQKDLTPMPQFQKKSELLITKEVFNKVERSAVMMRRMEYTARLKQVKANKIKISKARYIQKKWRQFFKFSYLRKVIIIQSFYRGFAKRKNFVNERVVIRNMYKAFRCKGCLSKHFRFFIFKLKKSFRKIEIGCQADILLPPVIEESQNEKLIELVTGTSGGGMLTGIKCFPRLHTEVGNNEKKLKKLLAKYNKNKNMNDNMEIINTSTLNLNLPLEEDDTVSEYKKKLFMNPSIKTLSKESSVRTLQTIPLAKKKVRVLTWNMMTKRTITLLQDKTFLRRKLHLKLLLLLIINYTSSSLKQFAFSLLIKNYFAPFHHEKYPTSMFSIENEVNENDMIRIEQMKTNFHSTKSKANFLIQNEDYNDTENDSTSIHVKPSKNTVISSQNIMIFNDE